MTHAAHEIRSVMCCAANLTEAIREQMPEIPENAISVGLINYGARVGCAGAGFEAVAQYLRDIADLIEARGGCDVPGGMQ